jgi:hypothetical protein
LEPTLHPFTCSTKFTQYHSPHDKDKVFGCLGSAYPNQWNGEGCIHIMGIELVPKAIIGPC